MHRLRVALGIALTTAAAGCGGPSSMPANPVGLDISVSFDDSRRVEGIVCAVVFALLTGSIEAPAVKIDLARGTERERKTKGTLEEVLAAYDLRKYTLTKHVLIERAPSTTRSRF